MNETSTFYKLTPEELMSFNKLRNSELRVLLYLKSIAPFEDRPVNVSVRAIARSLDLNPSTVSRALKELDRLGLASVEILAASVTVSPFSPSKDVLSPRNTQCTHATPDAPTQQQMHPRNNRSPEPSLSNGFKPSKTNKTNKTNKTRERAIEISNFLESNSSFRDFCLRKAQGLPSVPVLIDSWISANFEELKGLWAKSQTSSGVRSSAAAVVEAVQLYPQVQARIDRGELKQDPMFPEGVYDAQENWWKKADLEELNHVH
ncbi:hypothetical protein QUA70_19765 [Microcoleus sp. LAD1_D5]|uniref:helix-turn-helix domain-containing protein n=1 Tax=Microcoleus sp. LAD1_D5 TaxID=2818813 RepID=UPI002FD77A6A